MIKWTIRNGPLTIWSWNHLRNKSVDHSLDTAAFAMPIPDRDHSTSLTLELTFAKSLVGPTRLHHFFISFVGVISLAIVPSNGWCRQLPIVWHANWSTCVSSVSENGLGFVMIRTLGSSRRAAAGVGVCSSPQSEAIRTNHCSISNSIKSIRKIPLSFGS